MLLTRSNLGVILILKAWLHQYLVLTQKLFSNQFPYLLPVIWCCMGTLWIKWVKAGFLHITTWYSSLNNNNIFFKWTWTQKEKGRTISEVRIRRCWLLKTSKEIEKKNLKNRQEIQWNHHQADTLRTFPSVCLMEGSYLIEVCKNCTMFA